MEAVILAGGESLRMRPHVWIPKPLVELVDGITLLEWQILWLRRHGFDRILVVARNFKLPQLDVEWVEDPPGSGTGGALLLALRLCSSEKVYVLNCDDILLCDPREIFNASRPDVTVVVTQPHAPWGILELSEKEEGRSNLRRIESFVEKPRLNIYVSAGHYVWYCDAAMEVLPEKGDLETTALPELSKRGRAWAYVMEPSDHPIWITVNTYKDLLRAREVLTNIIKNIKVI